MLLVHFMDTIESSLKFKQFRLGQVLNSAFEAYMLAKYTWKTATSAAQRGEAQYFRRCGGVFTLFCFLWKRKITVYMAEIILNDFVIKRIE